MVSFISNVFQPLEEVSIFRVAVENSRDGRNIGAVISDVESVVCELDPVLVQVDDKWLVHICVFLN
jgi:hypothetical protein